MSSSPAGRSGVADEPAGSVLTVGDLMRPPTTTVDADAHVAAAAYLMKHSGDSALVVTTDDEARRLIAVITDADVSQAVADERDLENTRINGLGLPSPFAVEADLPVPDAAGAMVERALQHLPVVRDGRLVGLVDLQAICRALLADRQ